MLVQEIVLFSCVRFFLVLYCTNNSLYKVTCRLFYVIFSVLPNTHCTSLVPRLSVGAPGTRITLYTLSYSYYPMFKCKVTYTCTCTVVYIIFWWCSVKLDQLCFLGRFSFCSVEKAERKNLVKLVSQFLCCWLHVLYDLALF